MPPSEPVLTAQRPPRKNEVWEWCKFHFQTSLDQPALVALASRMWAWAYTHWVNNSGWDKPPDWKPGEPICAWAIPTRINELDYEEAVSGLWMTQRQYVAERSAA